MVKKVLNMKRFINFWKHFWIGIWRVIKQIGSVRGIIALILTWLLLSGVGVIFIGIVIKNAYLVGLGGTILAFWVAPFTPLIPIMLGFALLTQRFVFIDKGIEKDRVVALFKEAFKKKGDW